MTEYFLKRIQIQLVFSNNILIMIDDDHIRYCVEKILHRSIVTLKLISELFQSLNHLRVIWGF